MTHLVVKFTLSAFVRWFLFCRTGKERVMLRWTDYVRRVAPPGENLFKSCNVVFIHSFIQAISIAPLQVHYYSEARILCQVEAQEAALSEGLAQSPYGAAKAGFEPTTLRTKGDESTNEPPYPANCVLGATGPVYLFL